MWMDGIIWVIKIRFTPSDGCDYNPTPETCFMARLRDCSAYLNVFAVLCFGWVIFPRLHLFSQMDINDPTMLLKVRKNFLGGLPRIYFSTNMAQIVINILLFGELCSLQITTPFTAIQQWHYSKRKSLAEKCWVFPQVVKDIIQIQVSIPLLMCM